MFFIFLALFLLLHIYCCRRVWQALEIFPQSRKIFIILMILLGISYFANVAFASYFPLTVNRFVAFFGSTWVFVFSYSLIFIALIDVVRLSNKYLNFLPKSFFNNYPKTKFRILLTVVSLILVLCFVGFYNFNNPKITELEITVERKNNSQNSKNINCEINSEKTLNIIAVSDLHLGYIINKQRLQKYVELINSQKPDIVFFLGDIIDISLVPIFAQKMDEELKQIKAKYGVYFVAGNHEYIRGEYTEMMNFFRNCGFTVLADSAVLVNDEFYVVGRKDKIDGSRKNSFELTENLDKSKPIILLDHQPFNLEHSVEAEVDLHLSGHTHNGQFFPINFVVKQLYELPYGYKKKENTQFFVSSGLAAWGPPIRIGTKSELVRIKMKY